MLSGTAQAARQTAATAALAKGRFDRLSMNGVDGGVLVRGSVVPASGHVKAEVALFVSKGSKGAFKQVQTVKLAPDDRNFAFLDHLAPGRWGVKVRFRDRGQVVSATSRSKEITVTKVIGQAMHPGSIKVSGGSVTYTGSIPSSLIHTRVQLLGLDLGPATGTTPKSTSRTAASPFKILATTSVAKGTGKLNFTLHATVKRGQRWAFVLERSYGKITGIDYAGLRTVRVR